MSGLNNPSRNLFKSYTVIEMIMVMVIVAILTVSFFPRFNSINADIRLRGTAKKIMTDIRYTQSVAMSEHVMATINFNSSVNSYRAYYDSNSTNLTDPLSRQDLVVNFADDGQMNGVGLVSANFNGSESVTFDYRGVPYDSSSEILASTGRVILNNSYSNAIINVTPRTGMVDAVVQ